MPLTSYFKRKTQNLSTAIETIYGLSVNVEADKLLSVASDTFSDLLSFNLSEIIEMDNDTFLSETLKNNYSFSFMEMMTKFIFGTADIYIGLNKSDFANNLNQKGLLLLKYISKNDKTFSMEREENIKQLEEKFQK
jgi:hypothetical protein